MTQPATPQPISYPSITIAGKPYQLRLAHSAWFQLRQWGYQPESGKPIPIMALAAAAAGNLQPDGKWRTAGFERVVDFCDLMVEGDSTEDDISKAVLEALKKVAPKADLTLVQPSAEQTSEPKAD